MLTYLDRGLEAECCGCSACQEICKRKAIWLEPNEEGFFYPVMNEQLCNQCGRCEQVCPMHNEVISQKPLFAVAVQHKSKDVLMHSSSGGMFSILAEEILKTGGLIAGCIWDEQGRAIMELTSCEEMFHSMRGSKYLAADMNGIYPKVRDALEEGQTVLFTGTPCQCAGLKGYLKKNYEKLVLMDVFCHGTPSEKAYNSYRSFLQRKSGKVIKQIAFRDKRKHGWGVRESYRLGEKEYGRPGLTSPYIYGFEKQYFQRYSCYECRFQGEQRVSDISVGDFWGYRKSYSQLSSNEGISACIIYTQKGSSLFEKVKIRCMYHEVTLDSIESCNKHAVRLKRNEIPEIRKDIYNLIQEKGWRKLGKKELRCSGFYSKLLWDHLPDSIRAIIKMKKGK